MADSIDSPQFSLFKDSIARQLLRHPATAMDPDDDLNHPDTSALDEFATYLTTESWKTQPQSVIEATYENRHKVPDIDSISLDATSTAFVDTLISYGLASDPEEALKFLRKALSDYIEHACSPPPVWSSTRTTECEICEREVPLTYHHLIPRSTHNKVLKKGWHHETMLNSVAWLCRPCHSAVHGVATNEDLARHFYTVALLLEREDIQRWQKYAAKQRFGVRRG